MSDEEFDDSFPSDDAEGHDAHAETGGETPHDEPGEDFHEEEWESFDEDGAPTGDAPAKNKKKIDKIIIGGAVVVAVIGFLVMQMGHKKPVGGSGTVTNVATTALPSAPPPTPQDIVYGGKATGTGRAVMTDKAAPQLSGFLNDPNALKKIEAIQANHVASPTADADEEDANPTSVAAPQDNGKSPPMPTPMAQTLPANPAPTPTPAPTPVQAHSAVTEQDTAKAPVTQQPLTPLPDMAQHSATASADISSLPDNPPAPAATPSAVTPVTALSSPAPGLSAAAPKNDGGATDAAISGQLGRIADRLGSIENQLKTLQASAARKEEVQDLKSRLDSLQDRVNTMAHTPPVRTANDNAEKEAAVTAPVHHRATAAKHHTPKSDMTAAAETPARLISHHRQSPPSAGGAWVLKSAQPGVAMVARGDGQLLTVRPGDSLPGLGRIEDIRMADGGWVVLGANGRISE